MFTLFPVESVDEDGRQVKLKPEKFLQLFVEIMCPPGFDCHLSFVKYGKLFRFLLLLIEMASCLSVPRVMTPLGRLSTKVHTL